MNVSDLLINNEDRGVEDFLFCMIQLSRFTGTCFKMGPLEDAD